MPIGWGFRWQYTAGVVIKASTWFSAAVVGIALFGLGESLRACEADEVELLVLGSGGPEFDDGRNSSSYLLIVDGRARVLVDAGPGASHAFGDSGQRYAELDAILLTHLHVDHAGDLPAFVKGAYFSRRQRDLPLYGPAGNARMPATTEFVEGLFGETGVYRYLNEYLSADSNAAYRLLAVDVPLRRDEVHRYALAEDLRVSAAAVHHGPIAAVAWRIDLPGCAIVFSGDTSNRFGGLTMLASGADLAVMHNAVPENAGKAALNLHMPPSEIGRIAYAAGVESILLSHRMQRTLGKERDTLAGIRAHFEGPVQFAEDGKRFVVE